jgi:hypothetical protein
VLDTADDARDEENEGVEPEHGAEVTDTAVAVPPLLSTAISVDGVVTSPNERSPRVTSPSFTISRSGSRSRFIDGRASYTMCSSSSKRRDGFSLFVLERVRYAVCVASVVVEGCPVRTSEVVAAVETDGVAVVGIVE